MLFQGHLGAQFLPADLAVMLYSQMHSIHVLPEVPFKGEIFFTVGALVDFSLGTLLIRFATDVHDVDVLAHGLVGFPLGDIVVSLLRHG